MNSLLIGFCILFFSSFSDCEKLEGEIDLKEEHGFNTSKYSNEYFLTPLPLSTIRSVSYLIRQPNPFNINPNPVNPDMAYTKAYLQSGKDNKTKGFVQFRQISDMWLTEIRGVIESLEPNSTYLLVVHQNLVPDVKNNKSSKNLCDNLGQPFHYTPLQNINKLRNRNALGDLGLVRSNEKGYAVVNLNTVYTSLFGGPGTIVSRPIGIYKLRGEEVILNPIYCGHIKVPKYSTARFQSDPNGPLIRKLTHTSTTKIVSTSSTTEPTDFAKPPGSY